MKVVSTFNLSKGLQLLDVLSHFNESALLITRNKQYGFMECYTSKKNSGDLCLHSTCDLIVDQVLAINMPDGIYALSYPS